jgi:hypothetical protein
MQWFIEPDRATMTVARLAAKLDLYARYHQYRQPGRPELPGWRQRYRRFPRLLVILDGASENALEDRICDLAAAMALGRTVRGDRVITGAITLRKLGKHGPFAEIKSQMAPRAPKPEEITNIPVVAEYSAAGLDPVRAEGHLHPDEPRVWGRRASQGAGRGDGPHPAR